MRLFCRVVWNRRFLVKPSTQTVSRVFTDHAELVSLRFCDDRFTDVGNWASGCERLNSQIQAIERTLRYGLGCLCDVSNEKRLRRVAMPAVDDGREINVDNVTCSQLVVAGNSMADDFVDASATAFGKSLIAKRRGYMTVVARVLFDMPVDFSRSHTSDHLWTNKIK